MSATPVFVPRHPQQASTVLEQLKIDAHHVYVWQLLISQEDPIIREWLMFRIQLPDTPHVTYVQLGVIVMRDPHHVVFTLITNDPGTPPLILIARDGCQEFVDLTRLVRNPYSGMNLTFVNLG
jgi:hypothetical protein